MKYALLIYSNAHAWDGLSEEERNAQMGEYMAISSSPGILGGQELAGTETATTVRVRDGNTLTTDGPFV